VIVSAEHRMDKRQSNMRPSEAINKVHVICPQSYK